MVDQTIDYFNSTISEAGEVEEIARGVDTTNMFDLADMSDKAMGLFLCAAMLASVVYMSHRYTVHEREEIAEAERRTIVEEKEKEQEIETYRSKIAKIIESYAIHLTKITSTVLSPSRHNAADIDVSNDVPDNVTERTTSTRQIISGSADEEMEIDTIPVKSDSDEEVIDEVEAAVPMDNDNNEAVDIVSRNPCDTICTTIDVENKIQEQESPTQPLSSSSNTRRIRITQEILLEAVIGDPCAICLDPFRPGDDIVCCSNNVDGQKPHIFHKACSYDYIVNHTEGIQAPCPCCRNLLVPPKKQRKGCFKNIHTLGLTLPEVDRSDD